MKVTVTVEYDDVKITKVEEQHGPDNPLYAPRAMSHLTKVAAASVKSMLTSMTGDIDE